MVAFLLGKKSISSQQFDKSGDRIPTTFIDTTSCHLVSVATPEKRGYFSLKLGFCQAKNKLIANITTPNKIMVILLLCFFCVVFISFFFILSPPSYLE